MEVKVAAVLRIVRNISIHCQVVKSRSGDTLDLMLTSFMCDVCKICQKFIQYCVNTTNLNYHLKQNHPEEYGCTTANQGTSMASKDSNSIQSTS